MADLSVYLINLTLPRLRQIARQLDLDTDGTKEDIAVRVGNVVALDELSTADLRTIAKSIGVDSRGTNYMLVERLSTLLPNVAVGRTVLRPIEQSTFLPTGARLVTPSQVTVQEVNPFLPFTERGTTVRAVDSDLWRAANVEQTFKDIQGRRLQQLVDDTSKTCVTACTPKSKPIIFNAPKTPSPLTNVVLTGPAVPQSRLRVLGFPYDIAPGEWKDLSVGRASICYNSFRDVSRNDYVYVLIDSADNRPLATVSTVSALPGSIREGTVAIRKMCSLEADPRLGSMYLSELLLNVVAALKDRGFKLVYTFVPKTQLLVQPEELLASVGFQRYSSDKSNTDALMVYILNRDGLTPTLMSSFTVVIEEPNSKEEKLARRIAELVALNYPNRDLLDTILKP